MDRRVRIPSVESTPKTQRVTLKILMTGLVLCGFYVFVWAPILSRTEMIKGDLQQLNQAIQHYRSENGKRAELQTKIQELEKGLYGGSHALAQEVRREGVRLRVSRIAKTHQLEMTLWRPEAVVEGSHDGFKKTPIQVQVEGGYHQVAQFFSRILHLPEVLGISHFTMVALDDQTQNFHLRTDFVLTRLDALFAERVSRLGHHVPKPEVQPLGL